MASLVYEREIGVVERNDKKLPSTRAKGNKTFSNASGCLLIPFGRGPIPFWGYSAVQVFPSRLKTRSNKTLLLPLEKNVNGHDISNSRSPPLRSQITTQNQGLASARYWAFIDCTSKPFSII